MKVFVIAALLAVAVADNNPGYGAPAQTYQPQNQQQKQQPSYDTPPKYNFNYDVHGYGDYEPQFNAQEARDGYATQGSYSVVLPDGRTQTVTYRVDDAYSGTIADVTYEGEAKYPLQQPQQSYQPQQSHQPQAQQSYKPQQSFKPQQSYQSQSQQSYKPQQSYKAQQSYQPPAQQSYKPQQSFKPQQSYQPQSQQSYKPQQSFKSQQSYQPQQSYAGAPAPRAAGGKY